MWLEPEEAWLEPEEAWLEPDEAWLEGGGRVELSAGTEIRVRSSSASQEGKSPSMTKIVYPEGKIYYQGSLKKKLL